MEEKDMLEIVDIRDATEEEIKEYTRKQESPEWQQRMMQVFLHRPKCRQDCFGAASNDCGRCSGWNAKIKESENGSKSWR